ncbi:MAG: sugar phosphate isomerase/epimerase family protein [Planctomycetota bacterium]
MKLGLTTYNVAAKWDLGTIITTCEKLGYEGVELRTSHAHGVEVSLSKRERAEVRKRFEGSAVKLVGLSSAFEYHSTDAKELARNIEGTKEYVELARDVGAEGVKVRPNGFVQGVPREKTIAQIGDGLREVGEFARGHGVKIRLEVHGEGTCHPPVVKEMLARADHPNVFACWNSNMTDLDETSRIDKYFGMLKEYIEIVHINELWTKYPWERLFFLLEEAKFEGYCLAEIGESADAERLLSYYRALFRALERNARGR